ncbi:TetR/AcrR family transcriptional regulator [Nocardia sp. NPDC057353]|uniref:TetR/AcrR family transcriptional regulator n=1 Tax=Nocardia sp. NPDC057353 TaxID=3346104 RepID=UPI00362E1167
MSPPKLWRGQTLDDRTAERRELLLGVGHELLGTAGAAAVTMRAVARTANLSPRYFYESFESVEALLRAVYDRTEDGLRERLTGIPADGGTAAVLRRAFERCGDYFEEDPRRARILLREPLADPTLRAHSLTRAPLFLRALAPALPTGAELPAGDTGLAVTATALTGALVALYLEWADGRLPLDREELALAAVRTTLALTASS